MTGLSRERITLITHGEREVHNPLPAGRIDEALSFAPVGGADRAVDIGCGTGALLLRLAARTGCRGVGVDISDPAIERAREAASARGLAHLVEFVAGDARAFDPGDGRAGLAACVGSTHALGGLEPTARRLAALVRPGGHVLIGDGYWRRDPDPAYLEALGATAGELPDWAGLMRGASAPGLRPVWMAVAGEADWDDYEWTLIANGERWVAEHPHDPGVPDVLAWVDAARARLLAPGGRDTIGFALVLLRRVS